MCIFSNCNVQPMNNVIWETVTCIHCQCPSHFYLYCQITIVIFVHSFKSIVERRYVQIIVLTIKKMRLCKALCFWRWTLSISKSQFWSTRVGWYANHISLSNTLMRSGIIKFIYCLRILIVKNIEKKIKGRKRESKSNKMMNVVQFGSLCPQQTKT